MSSVSILNYISVTEVRVPTLVPYPVMYVPQVGPSLSYGRVVRIGLKFGLHPRSDQFARTARRR